jgi:hypothetical protein
LEQSKIDKSVILAGDAIFVPADMASTQKGKKVWITPVYTQIRQFRGGDGEIQGILKNIFYIPYIPKR